jgi:hypothetical protein
MYSVHREIFEKYIFILGRHSEEGAGKKWLIFQLSVMSLIVYIVYNYVRDDCDGLDNCHVHESDT